MGKILHVFFLNGNDVKYTLDENQSWQFINDGTMIRIINTEQDEEVYIPLATVILICIEHEEEIEKVEGEVVE